MARFLERSKRQRALIDHILIEREREKEGRGKGSRGDFNVPLPLVPLLREPFSPSKDKIVYTVGKKVAVKYRYNEPLSGPFKRGEPEGGPFWEGGRRKRIENNKLKRLKKPTGRKFPSSPLSLSGQRGEVDARFGQERGEQLDSRVSLLDNRGRTGIPSTNFHLPVGGGRGGGWAEHSFRP